MVTKTFVVKLWLFLIATSTLPSSVFKWNCLIYKPLENTFHLLNLYICTSEISSLGGLQTKFISDVLEFWVVIWFSYGANPYIMKCCKYSANPLWCVEMNTLQDKFPYFRTAQAKRCKYTHVGCPEVLHSGRRQTSFYWSSGALLSCVNENS